MGFVHDFYEVSPYEGFDPEQFPSDLQGWGSTDPIFRDIITALRPKLIVEVGTWKGASAIHMADIVVELGLDTKIICVDTWLGSPEHFLAEQAGWRESLLLRNGYPNLYFTFLSNVIRSGHSDRIIPLANTADNAAVILSRRKIRPDLVYIDAAHEEDPAYRDIRNYWSLLSENGVLLGDDYLAWEGVTRAACKFAFEVQRPIIGKWGKFVISRTDFIQPQISFSSDGLLREEQPMSDAETSFESESFVKEWALSTGESSGGAERGLELDYSETDRNAAHQSAPVHASEARLS